MLETKRLTVISFIGVYYYDVWRAPKLCNLLLIVRFCDRFISCKQIMESKAYKYIFLFYFITVLISVHDGTLSFIIHDSEV